MAGRDETVVPIGQGFAVHWDGARNWMVEREVTRKRKEGGETYGDVDVLGYYSTLESALRSLSREMVGCSGADSVEALLIAINRVESTIAEALAGLRLAEVAGRDEITVVMPSGAFGASAYDDELDTALRAIAVKASSNPEGEWAEKYGTTFANETFMMHQYCWCDREECGWCNGIMPSHRMPDDVVPDARPNFEYKPSGFKVWWYKYIGRSTETSGEADIPAMLADCLRSLEVAR